ncbi:MAG: LamG-like jellyroll fold domain-containing protein [Chthoniobacteraceae bacterium]
MKKPFLSRPWRSSARWLVAALLFAPLLAAGQTLNINNDVQTVATLTNTTVTMTGKAELHVTGAGDPITGCVINLNSAEAWFFLDNIAPSQASTFLGRVRVNGAAAVLDTNVRVTQYLLGAVVIPHAPGFTPMEVFDGANFTGPSKLLRLYTYYGDTNLGALKTAVSSFKLKRGYMATLGQQANGTGLNKVYVAQDGDLEVSVLPATLNNAVRYVRVFPWRWTLKKGWAGGGGGEVRPLWSYDWGASANSTLDVEYVPMRHNEWWDAYPNSKTNITHLLGYNEPERSDQGNISVAGAIAHWPELMATGLRLGAPAPSDGGLSWLYDFIDQCDALGYRVDFVPVHYYRSYWNAGDPAGAAAQFYNFLRAVHDRVKRPLWVTEWNNGANWTSDPDPTFPQQQATIAAMIDMLDNTPFVERYSVYNWVEDVRRMIWDDGSLTPAGVTYRDNASPLAYRQELADAVSSPAAHYLFEGNARDSSGNGNDGTQVGAPTFAAGKFSQSITLDGTTDYVQLPPQIADSTDFSFGAWVYWSGGANWQRLFDFGESTSRYLFLSPKSGGNNLRFAIKNGGSEQQLNWNAALPGNTWTHVAVTIAGTTGKLFVNGALVNSNTAMDINPVDCATKFNYLGKSQFADPLFNGRLDDVRFFTTALSDAQVATMASGVPPQFSANPLVKAGAIKLQPYTATIAGDATGGTGAMTFRKVSGPAWLAVAANGSLTGVPGSKDGGLNTFLVRATNSTGAMHTTTLQISVADASGLIARYAFDSTANASVGTAHGVTTGGPAYAAGQYGQAIDLDGVDDFVTLPYGVASSPEITFATWVNWDGGNPWQRILDFGNGTADNILLTPRSSANTLRFSMTIAGVSQSVETGQLATGSWVHVAVTLGANVGRLYVNGTLVATQTITFKPTDIEPAVNFLGKSQWPDPLFNGRLDEFMIFNRALTGTEVSVLITGRAPAFTVDPVNKPAAAIGQEYEQTLAGSATDPNAGSTFTFSKVSGPKWLTVAANGRLSGVPSAVDAGMSRFIVRVTDGTGLADDAALNIDVPEPSDLIAHYEFDSGTTNSSGGASGVTSGAISYDAGLFDKAIRLNGTDASVRLPAGLVNGLTDITVAARVRWNGGAIWQRIFDFGNNTTQYMLLTPNTSIGTMRFTISINGNAAGAEQILETSPLVIGEWTHVAVTLVGNTGTLYVNGAAVDSRTITIDPAAFNPINNYLGKAQFPDPLFNGLIDDFRVYNRGLAAVEISALAIPPAAIIVPDPSFAAWAAAITFPGGQSGPDADAERDGISNFFEYLFGSDPLTAGPSLLPQLQVRTGASLGGAAIPGKTYLSFQARVRKNRPGVTLSPQAGAAISDLALPAAATHAIQSGSPVSDGNYEIFTYYYDTPIEDVPAGFLRFRAVLN